MTAGAQNNYKVSGDVTPMIEEMAKEGVGIDSLRLRYALSSKIPFLTLRS